MIKWKMSPLLVPRKSPGKRLRVYAGDKNRVDVGIVRKGLLMRPC